MAAPGNTTQAGHDLLARPATPHVSYLDIISEEQGNIFRLVNFVTLSGLIALFGIFTNAVNMIVFFRQGFTTTTNISFFALAVSDMLCLIITEWYGICLNPYLEKFDDLPFIPKEIQYLSGGWLHVCFGRITSWITVFITAERCLGIALPLKVKQIVTLRRTTACMCLIFFINLAMLLPEYSIAYWDWKFVPAKNRSYVGLVYRSYKDAVYGLVYAMSSTSGILSFVAVIVLTSFLVNRLSQKSQWRKKATRGSDNSEAVSSRDKKTMKMIVMIAGVLIVCYIPGTVVSMASAVEPEFMIDHKYANSFFSFWSIAFVFDAINSSVNLFLYYTMSTKYRHTFNQLFPMCTKEKPKQTAPAESAVS